MAVDRDAARPRGTGSTARSRMCAVAAGFREAVVVEGDALMFIKAVIDGAERLLEGTGSRGGARAVRGAGAGGAAGGLAIAGAVHTRIICQGHRTTPATAGHDQLAVQQIRLHRFVAGFFPLQDFPQAAIAC